MAEQENQQYIAEETFELPSDGRMVLRTETVSYTHLTLPTTERV